MMTTQPITKSDAPASERDEIVACIRKYGSSASDAILDPQCKIFYMKDADGLVGYRIESSCAVVYGDPICPPQNLETVVKAFHEFCKDHHLNIIYITATANFAKWASSHPFGAIIEFGEELVINPHDDPKAQKGVNGSLVRRKVRHAQKEGTAVEEYTLANPRIEEAMEHVGSLWLKGREGLQIHTSNIHLFSDRTGKRWFYAKKGNDIVGVVVLNELKSHKGWLLNHLIHTKDAPNGTPELLLTTALDTVAKEGCNYVTFGSVPSPSLGNIVGLNPLTRGIARAVFKIANVLFKLSGRKKFWEKFHPESRPSFLLFSQPKIGFNEINALVKALHVSRPSKSNTPN